MKFTERGSKIQIARTGGDEAGGKKKEVIGTLKKPELTVDEELRSKLSADELKEVESYIGRAQRSITVDQEYAVANFVETLTKVSTWVKTADPEEVKEFHEKVRKPLTKLRRQFASSVGGEGSEKESGKKDKDKDKDDGDD